MTNVTKLQEKYAPLKVGIWDSEQRVLDLYLDVWERGEKVEFWLEDAYLMKDGLWVGEEDVIQRIVKEGCWFGARIVVENQISRQVRMRNKQGWGNEVRICTETLGFLSCILMTRFWHSCWTLLCLERVRGNLDLELEFVETSQKVKCWQGRWKLIMDGRW